MDAPVSIFQSDLSLEAKLDRARAELLDLTARNRLLNIPRSSKSTKTIEVADEKADEVFRILVREDKAFTFTPGREAPKSEEESQTEDESIFVDLPQPEADEAVDARGVASRHSDTKLQTRMTSKGLQKRLLDLYQDARTLEEEQGVNILFLALGTLKWTDPINAANIRYAPLVLIPVKLERASAGEKFKLRWRQEDPSPNLSLEAYLDRVHALKIPTFEAGDDFDPIPYFKALAEAVSTKQGWQVQSGDIILGLFSFAKFLMYRDLDPENWPDQARLTEHRLIRPLLSDGFEYQQNPIPDDARIDQYITPADMLHIVDSDSSQTLAVHEIRSGRDLVIQGPPGTGKSQTIANVIASAVADGKTVLFVAEKMAALEVVKRRLDYAGVGDACLELHSNKTNKRLVLEELRRTWELGSPRGDFPGGLLTRLTETRDALNSHADRMHTLHPTAGLSAYQVIGRVERLRQEGQRPADITLKGCNSWSGEDLHRRRALLAELATRVGEIGRPVDHPWRGVGLEVVAPMMADRLISRISELRGRIIGWCAEREELADLIEAQAPGSFSDTASVVVLAKRVISAPILGQDALGSPAWGSRAGDIERLIDAGRDYERVSASLAGIIQPNALDISIADFIPSLVVLPDTFDEDGFELIRSLSKLLPRLLEEGSRLAARLGVSETTWTLASLVRLSRTGERVAAAPDASPDAFAATVWEHGVEQAADLAGAVAILEKVRRAIEDRVTDAAWTTNASSARQSLAVHTGLLKRLKSDWRKANNLVRSILKTPDIPLIDLLACLDSLAAGQAALRTIQENESFGRAAFGAHWRSDRSSSEPLTALVEWMRTLRGLGAEPRIIASRLPERAELSTWAAAIQARLDEATAGLAALWKCLGRGVPAIFGDAIAYDQAELAIGAKRIAAIAEADEKTRAVLSDVPALPERLDRLRLLVARQGAASAIGQAEGLGAAAFGTAWLGTQSDWSMLTDAAHWISLNPDVRCLAARITDRSYLASLTTSVEVECDALLREINAVFAALRTDAKALFGQNSTLDLSPAQVAERFALWCDNAEGLSKWITYAGRAGQARVSGLGELVDRLHDGRITPADTLPMFEMAYFEALLVDLMHMDPVLARFDGTLHSSLVREFADLDRQRIAAARTEVVRAHHRRIPPPGGLGPVNVLRAEMARRRGHMPIRQLLQKASPAVQALKPVLMMSPLSVSQFLTPGRITFDLLVMDEASQIQPVDALGAIARCKQVVVVGDERQLPPTTFFAKMTGGQTDDDDEDSASVADIESILGLFVARGLRQRMLRWHYRSRHQSLIAVSNSEFYEDRLFIVPSPYTQEAGMGLRFYYVADGIFDSGGTAVNVVEAKLVAEAVVQHARSNAKLSLGVATFSSKQRRAIQDQLELLRRQNPDTEDFFRAHPTEPFFVKNLENVQGDERDVIMISVGYGRNAQGYMAMRFGPLGADGGERRLNVLISRAKRRCEVFASITDEDIDLERAKGKGVLAFKLFLHYARTGRLSLSRASGRDHDSVFEEQIAKALQSRGYQVHPQVGIAGFFIDLAVADPDQPGRYILGIECDGASYHSSQSARDRDRLRQAVLEDHGWIIHRIWSTDWFQRPQEQLESLVAAVEAAKTELRERAEAGNVASRAVPIEICTVERANASEVGLVNAGDAGFPSRPYIEASPAPLTSYELHETPSGLLAQLIEQVVDVEGPVHVDELVARLRSAWGLQRAGARIHSAVERGLEVAVRRGTIERQGSFLLIPGREPVVRDRSGVLSASLRRPDMLPSAELQAAIERVVRTSLGASAEECITAVSRMLGFKATSTQLRQAIQRDIDALCHEARLTQQGALLVTLPGLDDSRAGAKT